MSQYPLFESLKHNPMFAHLDTYAFQIIESYLSFKALAPKEVLFHEGDQGDYMAVVVAGKLEILKKVRRSPASKASSELMVKDSHDGSSMTNHLAIFASKALVYDTPALNKSKIKDYKILSPNYDKATRLATMKVGDSIGEMSIIDELARSATVRSLDKSGIIVLPKKDFDLILQDHPRIGISMLKGIATMLSINLRRTSDSLSKKTTKS